MFSALRSIRNPLRHLALLAATAALAACQVAAPGGGAGPRVADQTIQVAMLLPVSSGQGGDATIARSLENAARLAATELTGVTVEITVYDTAGQSAQAADVARQAVQEGADVIVGPLRSDAAAAVGVAVANSNVNVLSFSKQHRDRGRQRLRIWSKPIIQNMAAPGRVLRRLPGGHNTGFEYTSHINTPPRTSQATTLRPRSTKKLPQAAAAHPELAPPTE